MGLRLLFFVLLLLSFRSANAENCTFSSAPKLIGASPGHLLQYWDFEDSAVLQSPAIVTSSVFASYRSQVSTKLNVDPKTLLSRYLRAGGADDDNYNIGVILRSVTEYIRPARCIETLLLEYQLNRNPRMLVAPTEFFSVFLTDASGHLRVYYVTDDQNGLRNLRSLFLHVESDIADGWLVTGNLHNHNFFMANIDLDEAHHPQGVLAPSANDIGLFQSMREQYHLQEALITNGFDTVVIWADKFNLFRSAGPSK